MCIVGACDHGAVQRRQSLPKATSKTDPRFIRMSSLHCCNLPKASGGPLRRRMEPLHGLAHQTTCCNLSLASWVLVGIIETQEIAKTFNASGGNHT